VTHGETKELAVNFGRGLVDLGIKAGSQVSIFAANCPEWIIYLLGLMSQSLTCVPLYPTLGPTSLEYILDLVKTDTLVVSLENIPKLLKVLEKAPLLTAALKNIIVFDCILDGRFGNTNHVVTDKIREDFKAFNIDTYAFTEIIKRGENASHIPINTPDGDSPAFTMFTSGSTGNPKGAILTHRNLTSCAGCVSDIVHLPENVRMFLYLPLQHIYSVVLMSIAMTQTGNIFFNQPDVKQIASDLVLADCHILPTVPRIFVKFFQVIFNAVSEMSWIKRYYIMNAYNYQLNQTRKNLPMDPSYDKNVFAQFREKLGLKSCCIIIYGGSPVPASIFEFSKLLISTVKNQRTGQDGWVVSGYGLTETSAGSCISLHGDPCAGHIGGSIAALQFRLASVPDLDYDHNEGAGELLFHGNTVFGGYYKNEQENANAFLTDAKGRKWFKTGDIARINPGSNSLSIIDRRKSLIKNSLGEYLIMEKLCGTYGGSPLVSQIFIYGNAFKSFIVAVVSPNHMPLFKYAKERGWWGIKEEPIPGSLTHDVLGEFQRIGVDYQNELQDWIRPTLVACEGQLFSFEKIKSFWVETHFNDALGQSWNEANELMTPTLKLKYSPLTKHYIDVLKDMYEKGGEPAKSGEIFY
jgi:long-chain acyl-CoA synthetase